MSNTLSTLREYETVFIINPDITDDLVNELMERLKGILEKNGGTFLREDRWGKRKMAYEMKRNPRGNYVLFHYVAEQRAVGEVERTAKNADTVIRYITDMKGFVGDIEAKKAEVEKLVREKTAERARLEQQQRAEAEAERERERERLERGERPDRGDRDRGGYGDRDRGGYGDRDRGGRDQDDED